MSLGVSFSDLLVYTDWERDKWFSRFQEHGPGALTTGVGPHGDGRFATIGAMVRHIFSAELRYVERLSGRPLTGTASIATDSAEALFRLGKQSRHELRSFIDTFPAQAWDDSQELTLGKHTFAATPRKIVFHILVHEMKHWAQVATLLRLQGLTGDFHDVLFSPVLGGTGTRPQGQHSQR